MHARKLFAGLVTSAVAMSGVVLMAGPAHAVYNPDPDDPGFTPVSADLIGVGSDTTMHAMHLLGAAWNAQDPAPTFRIASYSALGGGTLPLPSGDLNRPNGSGSGKTVLYGAANNTDVDFARSSSANSTAENAAGLQAFPFALDQLRMVVSGNVTSNAPANLTPAQIVDIYKGNVTNWSELGGSPGVIAPKTPQPGSGTRSFWDAQLKAMNSGVTVTYGASVVEVQEHDNAEIKDNPNAVAPFSVGRAGLLGTTLSLRTGWQADRAVYNVVRGTDVSDPDVQAVFGSNGYLCSTEARPLIEEAGFKQLARPADGGVCGAPTQAATSVFVLNERVTTTTTLTVTSTTAGQAKLSAAVAGSSAPSGTVAFYKGATLIASGVPLTSGQAVRTVAATPGSQTYRAVFTPTGGSVFEPSEDEGTGFVKTSSKIAESFAKTIETTKKAKGNVTVTLAGIAAKAVGKVTIKEGKTTLVSKALSGGVAKIKLPKLAAGKHTLVITWSGDGNALGSSLKFTIKAKKPKKN